MMELPNYSRQLMQQLRAMRKEGQFCDCTILVGDSPHRAHKVVLAASSLLFRSLLEGSDSISIDTAVVSCQEFTCLLDMVYTGKLPPGKHNFTRIIAAADSLQMFDVAVGCKNILTNLMKQTTTTTTSTQPALPSLISTTTQPLVKRLQSQGAEQTASPKKAAPSLGKGVVKTTPSGGQVKSEVAEAAQVNELGESGDEPGVDMDPQGEPARRKGESSDGPACKRARLQLPEVIEQKTGSSVPVEESMSPGVCVDDRNGSSVLLEHCSELTELLNEVPSITELLSQAAHSSLGEEEREVVCGCCEGGDPGSAMEKLMDRVREGAVSEGGLRTLLHSVQENAPSPCPRLLRLLEEVQEREEDAQDTGGSEAEEQEEQPQSPGNADDNTNEEEEGQEDQEEEKEEDEGRGKRKPKPKGAASSQPYTCRWCTKTFSYKCRMVAHTKRCTLSQEARHRCPLCPQEVPTLRALQLHHAQAHPDSNRTKKRPQVTCDMCGRTFAHPSGMLYHKRTEHFEEKPFACEECGAKFGANSSLKNHMRLHTGEKPFHCKHCDMSFSVAAALAYHTKKKHSEGKMYACQYCEALFAQSIELTRHVRTHTGDKPYVCRECGKGFSQANGLSVHLQTFHNISEPHDCQKCRLSFSSLDDHRQHIQECHPKDFHQCPECKKVFSSPALLDKHKASHSGSKPFSCKLCHKSYQQLSGLWYHNRTTHPEVFAGQSHRQLKTLLQCSACSRFFPSANSLAKHQKAEHPGLVDPYTDELVTGHADMSSAVKCLYCPSLFPSEAEMQEHASSEHFSQEGAAFGCSLCPLVCPSQLQLQEHFLSCHIGALEEQEQASTSQMVIQTEEHDGEAEHVMSLNQSQLGGSQQVFVALGNSEDGQSSSEVVAVNVEDLLNGTVTFICGDSQ